MYRAGGWKFHQSRCVWNSCVHHNYCDATVVLLLHNNEFEKDKHHRVLINEQIGCIVLNEYKMRS